jgi:two-component system cell cycle response regulator DivK
MGRRLTCADIPTEPKRILIADDTASSRDLLRSILEASNYIVEEAIDGIQVLEIVEVFGPHLVILDLQMPKLDGYATAAALRRIPTLQLTPIIALSAALTQTAPDRISEAGFSGYLVKPIGPSRLRQCVAEALQSN